MSAPDATPLNPICAIVRGSFEDYRRETLPAPQRRMLREHLLGCEGCRAAAAADDPTFRFARPLNEEISQGETREILASVMTGVDLLRTERRIRGAKPSRRLRIGSVAAAAVAAAVLVSSGWGILQSPATPVRVRAAAGAPEAAPASAPASSASFSASAAQAGATALQPAAMSEDAPAPSADATVYDWNPGAGREEPRVVWIVDRGLDI